MGSVGSFLNRFTGNTAVAVGNIFSHGAVEQDNLLRHQRDLLPQVVEFIITQLDIIEQNLTLVVQIKAGNQIH